MKTNLIAFIEENRKKRTGKTSKRGKRIRDNKKNKNKNKKRKKKNSDVLGNDGSDYYYEVRPRAKNSR